MKWLLFWFLIAWLIFGVWTGNRRVSGVEYPVFKYGIN